MKVGIPIVLAMLFLVGCKGGNQTAESAPKVATLSAGTKVHAILLKELTSGGSGEGTDVPMMITEDVKSDTGDVVLPKGTPVSGRVTWSRSEGSLGALTNQPARLKFKFEDAKAVDGSTVKLSAKEGSAEDFELNRDNTGVIQVGSTVSTLADNRDNDQALSALREMFQNGDASRLSDPATKQKFAEIAEQLGLAKTTDLVKQNEVDKLTALVQQIRSGSTVASLASGGSATLVDAAVELAGVAGQIGSRLGKMLGGRNIHAYIGTPVEGVVLESVTVKLQPTK